MAMAVHSEAIPHRARPRTTVLQLVPVSLTGTPRKPKIIATIPASQSTVIGAA
jgi:hypothetical protein